MAASTMSLLQHVKKANYQCAIWKKSFEPSPYVPTPVGFGWSMENDILVVNWDDVLPASEAVMVLLSCECKTECVIDTCPCLQNTQMYTFV